MAERKPRSVNLDVEHIEWMDENVYNRSEFINELISLHRQGTGEMNEAVARFRREQLRSQEASLETRLESVRSELTTVEEDIATAQNETAIEVAEAAENLTGVTLTKENPAVRKQAKNVGMATDELIEAVREWREENRD